MLHLRTDCMDSSEDARKELDEISAEYDRIEAELVEIKRELDKPILGRS